MVTRTSSGGHRQFLTRRIVVAAGRRVAESEGVGGLTIRRVAAELGAAPMAIYRHVKDKHELTMALLEDVAEGLPALPTEGGTPQERIVAAFAAVDAYLAQHVWVVEILRQGELFAPRAASLFVWTLDQFAELGMDDRQATDAYAQLWWYVLGHLCYLPGVAPERRAAREGLLSSSVDDPERVRRAVRPFDHQTAFLSGLGTLVGALATR
ncbi:TetR/AcrR family transcriptional regulator [Herbidospora galbida]|uniref:TetR/AcrR family transcriptional regulator n=1 Tax=Herbidospora galbida TaxID=2575442 RepID=UPI001484CD13|nr:TetR/AcrR family transcriptional regulator [Herbidospora galbida]